MHLDALGPTARVVHATGLIVLAGAIAPVVGLNISAPVVSPLGIWSRTIQTLEGSPEVITLRGGPEAIHLAKTQCRTNGHDSDAHAAHKDICIYYYLPIEL